MDSETEGSSEAGGSEGSSSPPAAPVSAVPAAAAGAAVLVVLASLLTSAWLPVQGTRILVPVLLCSMNLCFAVAFVSFWSQAHGLVGPDGILPIGSKGLPLLQTLRKAAATEGLHRRVALDLLTAVLRFGQPRPGLRLCGLGLLLAVLAAAMVSFETTRSVGALLLLLQCLIYRALFYAGSDFMALQWDTLLHEAGLWSALLALQPELPLAALRLLAAKLFLQAAACKLIAEEPTWRQLRALDYHFQSQPLPTLLGLVVHRLCCPCISKLGCGFVLAAELCAPLLSFGVHRYCRLAAFSLCAVLMLAIGLTGNYGFFNLLSTVVALSFLGDDVFAWTSRTVRELVEGQDDLVNITNVSFGPFGGHEPSDPGRGVNETLKDLAGELLSELEGVPFNEEPLILQICETAFMTLLALLVGCYALENVVVLMDGFSRPSADAPEAPGWQRWLRGMRLLRQVGACGSYGLFGHVEKKRLELVISQQKQGQWQELRHRYKPGDVNRMSWRWLWWHLPRLDWLLWLCAVRMGSQRSLELQRRLRLRPMAAAPEWFNLFLAKLKRREPAVVALLQAQELDASEALKVELYEYEWAACTCKERTEDSESEEALWERGRWWRRRKVLDVT